MPDIPGRKKDKGFISPAPGKDMPEHAKTILSHAYSSCRAQWTKEHPNDRENQGNKESCARIAWSAVHKAGFSEDSMKDFMKINLEEYIHTDQPIEVVKNDPVNDDPNASKKVFSFNDKIDPLETRDLMGMEIFQVGNWKGVPFTEQDLEECVQNFKAGILGSEPYVTIDHSALATKEFQAGLDGMALGFISDLFKMGAGDDCKLVANLKKVPRVIFELIQAGALKNKSVELWRKYPAQDGNIYRNVLEAVTLTGKLPAVHNLSDFVALYKSETKADKVKGEKYSFQSEDKEALTLSEPGHVAGGAEASQKQSFKESKMDGKIEITLDEYKRFLKLETEKQISDEQLMKFKADKDSLAKEKEKIANEKAELVKFKADTEARQKANVKAEAEEFVSAQVKHCRILPKYKGMYIEQYLTFKAEGKDKLSLFKEEIRSRKEAVKLGAISWAPEGATPDEIEKINLKKMSYEEMDKAVHHVMKKYGIKNYEDAMKKMGALNDDGSPASDDDGELKKIKKMVADEHARLSKDEEGEEDEDSIVKNEEDEDENEPANEDEEKK